jgi:hypothetical protein
MKEGGSACVVCMILVSASLTKVNIGIHILNEGTHKAGFPFCSQQQCDNEDDGQQRGTTIYCEI